MPEIHQPLFSQRQDQRLQQILSPQMRQSLEVLQAPLLELRTLIRQQIEQNPAIEEKIEDHASLDMENPAEAAPEADAGPDEEFRRLAELDESWREFFRQAGPAVRRAPDEEERRQRLLDSLVRPTSLQEHLVRQLALADMPDEERRIAELLIGSLNDDGWLNITLGELAETTGVPVDTLERVLRRVQEMDPPGIAARDLTECLRLQLERRGLGNSVAARIVSGHLEDLARHRHRDIAHAIGAPVADVYAAARLISTLDPRPGRDFAGDPAVEVVPDVTLSFSDGKPVIHLHNERLPRLRISRQYRRLMEDPSTPAATRAYIREKIRAGEQLIRSIYQRQDTLAGIAREIAERQRDFFERGPAGLRPMTMAQIAAALNVHETTISRAVSGKYMDTPRGVFPLRYFFSTGYQAADGRDVSNQAVKETIGELIEQEDVRAPLSDDTIARRLAERGLKVARRTVAKYREAMGIPPSHQRRA